ncbi:MAG TPA: SEC-C domain-containing protein [Solirubrobacterales bacterium]|nr:SEC-C domain-containing protein [Solirubrobacterales bacterium]
MALLDSLLGAVIFAAAATLLPVSPAVRAIVLGALLLCLWLGVERKWSLPLPGSGSSSGQLRRAMGRLLFRVRLSLMLNSPLASPTASPALSEVGLDRIEIDPMEIEIDPREVKSEPRESIPPPPPPPPPSSRVVVSPLAIWEQSGYPVSGVAGRPALPGLGLNDPCWCGSGKKYKKCHGA